MSELVIARLIAKGVEGGSAPKLAQSRFATLVAGEGTGHAGDLLKLSRAARGEVARAVDAHATVAVTDATHKPGPGTSFELKELMARPVELGARLVDMVTGHTRVKIDTHHTVIGNSPAKWADEFLTDPSQISPIATNARREGKAWVGKPFPLGPDIGIEVKTRHDGVTADGLARTVLEVEYSGAFQGPGRITITQQRNGTLDVRDEWNRVLNKSLLPTVAAQAGHPLVAGLGFKAIGSRAHGQQSNLTAAVGQTVLATSFRVMTAPFALLSKFISP